VPGGYCAIQYSVHCITLIGESYIAFDGIVCWVVCALCVYFVFDGLLVFVRMIFLCWLCFPHMPAA